MKKFLIVQVAGLGYDFLKENHGVEWDGLTFKPVQSPFPALTCSIQAAFRTGLSPAKAGVVANGFFNRELGRVMFWEQSSALVEGPRIWDGIRKSGGKVAMLFWQESMGESVDFMLTPAPVHKHHGGMIQDCYSQPTDLYRRVCAELGRKFDLKHYWGPMASAKSSRWIAEATAFIMKDPQSAPDLCMTYLPALDYDLQRYGVRHERSRDALVELFDQLDLLAGAAKKNGYEILVFGDYAIGDVTGGPVFLNRVLREGGMFSTREIGGMLYPDFHASRAFAVVDHEIAHVYIRDKVDVVNVEKILRNVDGVGELMHSARDGWHERAGELIAVAAEGRWFAYPWWSEKGQAPDYASHVDIHNKPGYDPCELFFGLVPWCVSTDATKIRGSHGAVRSGRETCWASSWIEGDIDSIERLGRYF